MCANRATIFGAKYLNFSWTLDYPYEVEKLLMRWVNFQLEKKGMKPITNFKSDLLDGEVLLHLIRHWQN